MYLSRVNRRHFCHNCFCLFSKKMYSKRIKSRLLALGGNLSFCITKTYLYNFDPLKPHFYKVKLGLQGFILFFLISVQNIDCGYSLELPREAVRTNTHKGFSGNMKNIRYLFDNFQFWR